MHLLDVNTFSLEDFFHETPPPYAILSHVKGDEDEPETWATTTKRCCEQAKNDGYGYVWIDTCCIDKLNSVEWQETFYSRFRLYKDAAICYAFLADVPHGDRNPHDPSSCFAHSYWFTTCWTLQEMLAPQNLRFYNEGWEYLGTKGELCSLLENITGIPQEFLLHINPLGSASVAQRMSWAASRVTDREEDIVYCLMGIFDVTMLLIYGEGWNKAFRRFLQHFKYTRDESTLALVYQLPEPTLETIAALILKEIDEQTKRLKELYPAKYDKFLDHSGDSGGPPNLHRHLMHIVSKTSDASSDVPAPDTAVQTRQSRYGSG